MRTWKDVATLVKTRSLNGRFVARAAADLPVVLEAGMEVAFVPPRTDLPRSGVVNEVALRDDGSFEVTFDSVTDEDTARGLLGCHCLARRDAIREEAYEDPSGAWIGWSVEQRGGEPVGVVTDLIDNPAHFLIQVERPGDAGEALIPAVDEFVVSVDASTRVITVDLPAGLLDL